MTKDAGQGGSLHGATGARHKRRRALLRGHLAEWLAMVFLMFKGYRPLARRFSAAGGEIDLIMRRGDTVIFVEVKARARLDLARAAIGGRKHRLFARAVRAWRARNPWSSGFTLRADAVYVTPASLPYHESDAFAIVEL
ncbi:MAG: YraN family protein [Salinarimonas sp.]|nr:YraN family protein [Salinarimonas sp.]